MAKETSITLYEHPIGDELGLVHLVIRNPEDDESMRLICTSERGRDFGVVFSVDIDEYAYEETCNDYGVSTLEGCALATYHDQIELREVPESPPTGRVKNLKKDKTLRSLTNPNMWTHSWGRCNCVKHGNGIEPITPERIRDGEVPWWSSEFTPLQLDLMTSSNSDHDKPMHLLCDETEFCGRCESHTWVVYPEDVPIDRPMQATFEHGDDPLLSSTDALSQVPWSSKGEAWSLFLNDPRNRAIINESDLPIERCNQKRRFTNEKIFEVINRRPDVKRNLHTIKSVFYFALGSTKKGTWGDFNLELMRQLKGLQDVDIPTEILEQIDLGDDAANSNLHRSAALRETKSEVDDEAQMLDNILDEEAALLSLDDEDENLDVPDDFMPDEQDLSEAAEMVVQKANRISKKKGSAKRNLITACQQLQTALSVFVASLEDEDDEEDSQKHAM